MRVTPNVAGARHDRQVEIDRDAFRAEVERVTALAERLAAALREIVAHDTDDEPYDQCFEEIMWTATAALAAWKERQCGQGELPEASQRPQERQGTE